MGAAKTYEHVTPYEDEPGDHFEGDCPCNPLMDEESATVFHRPMPPRVEGGGE